MSIESSLSFCGPPIDDLEILERVPGPLRSLIEPHNGFVCLDGALHVRGACRRPGWHSLRRAWHGESALASVLPGIEASDVPFAQTTFGDQIVLRDHAVLRVCAETGEAAALGMSLGRFVAALEKEPRRVLALDPEQRPAGSATREQDALLGFWFETCREQPDRIGEQTLRWFAGGDRFDDALRARFGHLLERAETGPLDGAWSASPRGIVASALVLDQLPRNLRRGDARAFALDGRARALCRNALEEGIDERVSPIEAIFLYLPFEHSECLDDQRRCVELFRALVGRAPAAARGSFEGFVGYARQHLEQIERFGRFPHRNRVLGRSSTSEEIAFLEQGGGFG